MRKSEREITDFAGIVDLVGRCDAIRLGLNDAGAPYVLPLSFGFEAAGGKLVFYFHGARAGKKLDLIARDPRVCVEGDICRGFVENGHGGLTCDYESFIAYGKAALVTGNEAEKGLRLLLGHCGYPEYRCSPEVTAVTAVCKIEIDEVTAKRRNLNPAKEAGRPPRPGPSKIWNGLDSAFIII